MKYGALSNGTGRVAVAWQSDGETTTLHWRERGGPEAKEPAAYGFGSQLVVRTLKALSGGITPSFEPDGLSCEITFRQ